MQKYPPWCDLALTNKHKTAVKCTAGKNGVDGINSGGMNYVRVCTHCVLSCAQPLQHNLCLFYAA